MPARGIAWLDLKAKGSWIVSFLFFLRALWKVFSVETMMSQGHDRPARCSFHMDGVTHDWS